ncbi:threonylcarbamoyl-AMP synthase [bacterium]|nr:threonylcarbamoyl-AMP synthase [bacterium]
MIPTKSLKLQETLNSPNTIHEIIFSLNSGGVMCYPTETTYGLGCSSLMADSITRINQIKKRADNTSQILLTTFNDIQKWLVNPGKYTDLFKSVWPGPVSIILKSNQKLPDILSNEEGGIAFRISPNPLPQRIVNELGCPITSTSANLSGYNTPRTAADLIKLFHGKIEYIIYDVKPIYNVYSTLIDATDYPLQIKVIREGVYPIDKLKGIFPDARFEYL